MSPAMRSLMMLACVCGIGRAAAAQERRDIVQGRVSGDSGRAVAGAEVIVTRNADHQFKSATTDSLGRYRVVWTDGTGDYTVRAAAAGYQALTRPVTRGADSVLVADLQLVRAAATVLRPITVQGQAPRPGRDQTNAVDVGAAENTLFIGNANRRLPPDLASDLASIATLAMPAAMPNAGGFSVLGLGQGQNSVTLNGMAFAGAAIPRSARTIVRVSATSYDPANGWFSGARTNVQLAPGGLFSSWDGHLTLDAPALQATDVVGRGVGQRFTSFNGSLGGDGRLFEDRYAYNVSLQGSRRAADVASLFTADPSLLAHAGVAPDSAARLRQELQALGVPTVGPGAPLNATRDNLVFLGRLDHAPYNWNSMTPARSTWGLTGYASWNRNQGQGAAPTGTSGHASTASQAIASLTGDYSFYFGRDYLGDVRSGLTWTRSWTDPYLAIPDARVLVASDFPDGSAGVSTLQFGGLGQATDSRRWTWESIAELQLYPAGQSRHRVKLTADARLDGVTAVSQANALGTFSYNSLADVANGQAASFTRTFGAPTRRSGAWNAFLAAGDLWRVSPRLQVLYGARIEADAFTTTPAYNPAVDSVFGVRTSHAPNTVHASPRFGFTWIRPGPNGRPLGTLRGGVGEFRNLLDPGLLANAYASTGLPGGVRRLACVGGAVPTPDWAGYTGDSSTIPTQCVGGGGALADAAPGVQLVGPAFTAQHSWRANLSWTSSWHRNVYGIEAVYSDNLAQPGTVDLNFAGTPRFTLPGEGRPMYVNAADIVPATGSVSAVSGRRSAAFGRVAESVSDLRSQSRQVTLTFRPALSLGRRIGDPQISWTIASVRAQQRGFDAPVFGDPRAAAWSRGDLDARHQVQVQTVIRPTGGFNVLLFLYGRLQSGLPYTPVIGSDVNGDGLANDRAFVFDPAVTTDTALSGGLTRLMATASPSARRCLASQLGRAAGRASCEGPWTAALNASLRLDGSLFHQPRVAITVNVANPLSGIDQLLHGSNGLRGWGASAAPDPVLYTVRGWDSSASRFLYRVNPRFGSTSPSLTTIRAPFRLTLDVNVDLGRSQTAQQLDRWMKPGRAGHPGSRAGAADLKRKFQRTVVDPYAELLAQADSLLLTPEQAASLREAQREYGAHMDSVFTALAGELASMPDDYDGSAAYHRTDGAIDDAWEWARLDVQRRLPAILTPTQLTILPGWARQIYQAPSRMHVRIFNGG